jgi:hypothetical protein
VTEIGRRTGLFTGVTAFTISALWGIFTGDMFMSLLYSLVAGIIFGMGGMLIGNLFESYTFRAAKRELTRQAIERELNEQMRVAQVSEDASGESLEVSPEVGE